MPADDWQPRLRENVARVRAQIEAACRRTGRDPATVCLVGVTKYVPTDVVRALVAMGVPDVAENHVQQLVRRAEELGGFRLDWPEGPENAPDSLPRWHMIGHLQRNKIRPLLPYARIVHSLDSQRLACALQEQAERIGAQVDVLIEVNIAGETTKTGIPPAEVPGLVQTVAQCPRLCLRGLMTMTPYNPDPEASRPYFRRAREMLAELQAAGAPATCRHLSMGMSQDYVVAVEEGATLVRVGSALFEGLPTSDPRAH